MGLKKYLIEQHDSNDCGAACLAMVCKYYGQDFSITKIRDVVGTDINGTPVNGLHYGAAKLGFDVKKVRITKEVISEDFTLPAICHVRTPEGGSHFVVLFSNRGGRITVLDPSQGLKKYTVDEFFTMFDGLMLFMYPNEGFKHSKNNSSSILSQFIALIKPQKKLFIFAIISSVMLTALGIAGSLFNKVLMDEILPYQLDDLLVAYTIGFGLMIIVRVLLSIVRQHLVLYLSQRIDLPLMLGYFKHIFKLPIGFFANRKIGNITTRFQDAFTIKKILTDVMLTIVIDVFLAIITAIIMIVMSWKLFLIILAITILNAGLIYAYKGIYKKLNKKQMEQNARLNANIIESLKGIETIKANAYSDQVMDKVETDYVNFLKLNFSQGFHNNIQSGLSQILLGLGNLVLMAVGVYFVIQGQFTIGSVLAFFTLAGYFMDPIGRLISLQLQVQEASISLKRLAEIMEVEEEELDESNRETLNEVKGDVEIKNLTFRYGSRSPILKNINIKIPQGHKVAIVGESGVGKSTLAKLLLKFYQPETGEILLDGKELKNINAFSIRENIGYVPQNIEMFSGNLLDNIRVGKENATKEEIIQSCEAVGADKFINRLPYGYETFFDETGGGLSGGEKQRLALARAFVKRPNFIIMDEATSNLDFKTEKEVSDLLFSNNNKSMLVITHRLSTIRKCNYIYVLDRGEVVEEGQHDELLTKNGKYYKLWSTQTGIGVESNTNSQTKATESINDGDQNQQDNDIEGDVIEYY